MPNPNVLEKELHRMPWLFFKKKRKVGITAVRKGSASTHIIFLPTSKRYNSR